MKFGDFYYKLYKSCKVNDKTNSYRVRVTHISGYDYYKGVIGDIPVKIFELLSPFNVLTTCGDSDKKLFTIYIY